LAGKQPGGIGQYAEMDAVVVFRACSRHRILPASIQLWLVFPRACLADSAAFFHLSTCRPGAGPAGPAADRPYRPYRKKLFERPVGL
jgi:hypothetical protein